MIVRLVFAALAFALPLVVLYTYRHVVGADKRAPPPNKVWALAVILAIASFLAPALLEPPNTGTFEPAHLENGVLVPDRVIP
jgi:hypothetical protein